MKYNKGSTANDLGYVGRQDLHINRYDIQINLSTDLYRNDLTRAFMKPITFLRSGGSDGEKWSIRKL
jgi:hypothetical protein